MHRTFGSPHPVSLFVELRSGDLVVRATDTSESVVAVTGKDADAVSVDQHGDEILVVARQGGFFGLSPHLSVRVTVPTDSRLTAKLGSAGVRVEGRIGTAAVRTGAGDVQLDEVGADARIDTGSGAVRVDAVTGSLQVRCGSGDVTVDRVGGSAEISTGSGSVTVTAAHQAVVIKSGSGDLRVRDALEDVALSTASGDLVVDRMHHGRLSAKNVSGDISVGVPTGIPVWTDVTTMTGSVRSDLAGAGRPDKDQDFLELRATSVSGDVTLAQLADQPIAQRLADQ
jgi:DUF4097 and DUF4098 domain-containing protein YvlB